MTACNTHQLLALQQLLEAITATGSNHNCTAMQCEIILYEQAGGQSMLLSPRRVLFCLLGFA